MAVPFFGTVSRFSHSLAHSTRLALSSFSSISLNPHSGLPCYKINSHSELPLMLHKVSLTIVYVCGATLRMYVYVLNSVHLYSLTGLTIHSFIHSYTIRLHLRTNLLSLKRYFQMIWSSGSCWFTVLRGVTKSLRTQVITTLFA